MLDDMAARYGGKSCGIVLTGMGDDGVQGLQAIAKAGGRVLCQDGQSSTVDGMPRHAREEVEGVLVLGDDAIGAYLVALTGNAG